jgi:hypothetical protein
MAESYHTRTNGGETGGEMPDDERDLGGSKEGDVLRDSGHLQVNPVPSRGESTDPWHVAEWDDVYWTVTNPPDRATPDLWRVAP